MKTLDELEKQIKKIMVEAGNQDVMTMLAKKAKEIIYKRVKSGKGVYGDSVGGLKPLSANYKKQRSKYTLGEYGTAGRSNLTLTGQMLDAISYEVAKDYFKLFIENSSRRPVKAGHKTPSVTNKQVAEYVQMQRPFFKLAAEEELNLKREFDRIIKILVKVNIR